jgi:hypothetical protein
MTWAELIQQGHHKNEWVYSMDDKNLVSATKLKITV